MTETTMPAAEADSVVALEDERASYECAFHVLPTVAEGEVPKVFDEVKALITKAGGEFFDEEAPKRFDLAYEIVKHIEGKNRKFQSAYFGWVRFKLDSQALVEVIEDIDERPDMLRSMTIKLTKVEEAYPFRFHEALESEKMVTNVDASKVIPDVTTVEASDDSDDSADDEESVEEVDEAELEKALEKDEV